MIREITINSFEQYVSEVNSLGKELWFRGVKNKTYSLKPGAVRSNLDGRKEITAVLDFMESYRIYHDEVSNPWELYSLMQHYGFPTRLLDWSTSLLVGLYFSLDGEPDIVSGKPVERVVWAMTTGMLNTTNFLGKRILPTVSGKRKQTEQYLPSPLRSCEEESVDFEENPLALKIPPTNRRIQAQKGVFTIHGSNHKGIEEVMVDYGLQDEVFKFVFDENVANKIRKSMHSMQINEDDIYQDLNSLSQRIIRRRKI